VVLADPLVRRALAIVGLGALVAGGVAAFAAFAVGLLLLGPLLFWLAWNVLDLGHAVGLPELGFWGILLAALFLGLDWFGKMVIVAIVFIVDPGWFHGTARVRWPEPSFRNFVAIGLVMVLAVRPLRAWRPRRERRGARAG
jgi:hypothetical protein